MKYILLGNSCYTSKPKDVCIKLYIRKRSFDEMQHRRFAVLNIELREAFQILVSVLQSHKSKI